MAEKIGSGTVNISIRLDKEIKKDAEILFSELGLNMTTAINIFLRRCLIDDTIPFEIGLRKPNAETTAAIEELEAMRRGDIPERTMSREEVFGKR
ncbi:MAG: type II toxin-antitoxin system RelB/DinJ family antitoxin [Methanomassiliicoccaceae archaeon]|nr:type II toxin-antitoxin system RelB/DinJ family antitoxin [Methanomassiliicoccaceae archaeon]